MSHKAKEEAANSAPTDLRLVKFMMLLLRSTTVFRNLDDTNIAL